MAARVTPADPGRFLLDKIDAREQALTREAGQAQATIDELTARLRELTEAISDLQITRKTLISLAGHDDSRAAAEPAGPSAELPDHPACQQTLTAFADLRRPLRDRDLCVALDLPIVSKHAENIRSKLKRPVSKGILSETEPGLLTQPHPEPGPQASSQATQPSRRKGNQLANRPLRARSSLVGDKIGSQFQR
jgi:hypothetical protein